jgi:nuclear GTP-binding protein
MLKNVVRVEELNDPISVVENIVKKIDINTLIELYEIQKFNTTNEFLALVARKRGKLIKVISLFISDWNP